MAKVLLLRTAWIADILSQAPLCDVQRQHWNRGSGDGQRLWDYDTTERYFNAVSVLCIAVERRGSTLTQTTSKLGQQPIAKSGTFVRCVYSRTALDCKKKTIYAFRTRQQPHDTGEYRRSVVLYCGNAQTPNRGQQSYKEQS